LDHVWDPIEERREILLNNIYGVDLNEESVDITKLSLFLKVCRKGLILPNLEKNIKCGNSLISDPNFSDKSFQWKTEFPEIFKDGGFDVLIGNPPYVRHQGIKEYKSYLKDNYQAYTGLSDLYVYFFEKGLEILKHQGKLGFISSNKFIKVNYGQKLRKLILENFIFDKYVDHTYDSVFEGATTYPSVFILTKDLNNSDNNILINNKFEMEQSRLDYNSWGFEQPEILDLKDKIFKKGIKIKNIPGINFYIGIMTGLNEAFVIDETIKNEIINEDNKSSTFIKPLIRGKDIKRYHIDNNNLYLLYIPWNFPINEYNSIKNHLDKFKGNLLNRAVVKDGTIEWYALQRYAAGYFHEFENPKLIYPAIAQSLFTVYDDNKFFINDKCYLLTSKTLDIKYLGVLMSSRLLNFVFKFLGAPLQGNSFNLNKIFVEQLPIYSATVEEKRPFIIKANKMLELNKNLQYELNTFKDWLMHTFNIGKLSQKLEKYYELSFEDFLNEVKKKKINVKSRDNYQTLKQEFEKSITIMNPLLQQITETDSEIDKLVYGLYGLNEDEIKIVEED
jgi:hypothetical protein